MELSLPSGAAEIQQKEKVGNVTYTKGQKNPSVKCVKYNVLNKMHSMHMSINYTLL